jgi:pullulanase/glycogen debranching enzyme
MNGLSLLPEHSVNYLESHDGYTFGDFIRLGLGDVKKDQTIENIDTSVKLTGQQMKLNKLGALFLFTSRGITMISEGQEFARTKVISNSNGVPDPEKGKLDHNSYNKDNETNYINYNHAELNSDLLNYYKGLIKLRNKFEAFRRAEKNDVYFFDINDNHFALGYLLEYKNDKFIALFNANVDRKEEFILPEGEWNILVNSDNAGTDSLGIVQNKMSLESSTGVVLINRK